MPRDLGLRRSHQGEGAGENAGKYDSAHISPPSSGTRSGRGSGDSSTLRPARTCVRPTTPAHCRWPERSARPRGRLRAAACSYAIWRQTTRLRPRRAGTAVAAKEHTPAPRGAPYAALSQLARSCWRHGGTVAGCFAAPRRAVHYFAKQQSAPQSRSSARLRHQWLLPRPHLMQGSARALRVRSSFAS